MKNIYLLCLGILFNTALYSQSLKIYNQAGTTEISGTTITANGTTDAMIQVLAAVKNVSSDTIPVKVKKIELSLISGSECSICWGSCYPPNIFTAPSTINIAPNEMNTNGFSGDYQALGNQGTSSVMFVFYARNNPSDSVAITVNFTAVPASVNELYTKTTKISAPLPNPANEIAKFNYCLSKEVENANIIICDLLGNQVFESKITDKEGSIVVETSNFNNGVYFYSFIVDGKATISRKLVIKH